MVNRFTMDAKQTKSKSKNRKSKHNLTAEQKRKIIERGNPKIDNNVIKGYN